MDYIQHLVSGTIQGLGEFLPISSSAHLILTPWLFGWKDYGLTYDVLLHFGTLLAVLIYMRKDVLMLFQSFVSLLKNKLVPKTDNEKLLVAIIAATIPAGIAGKLGESYIEEHFRSVPAIAVTLGAVGLLMLIIDRKDKIFGKGLSQMSPRYALIIGLVQCLALFPGVSRSGCTILAALLFGFSRQSAARFSFLLSMPIIAGASLLKAKVLFELNPSELGFYLIAIGSSFVSGLLAIHLLLKLVSKYTFRIFGYYRLALSLFIIVVIIIR